LGELGARLSSAGLIVMFIDARAFSLPNRKKVKEKGEIEEQNE